MDTIPTWTPTPGKALVMRTSRADRSSHSTPTGEPFIWPESGSVEAPDWDPRSRCGGGLHGLLWGAGNHGDLLRPDGIWQVVEVDASDVVQLGGKVKFPRGVVVYSGDAVIAGALVSAHAPVGTRVHRGTATAGDEGTATAGDEGTATAGHRGTATAGDEGTATAGYRGTATAGHRGTATAGDEGTATAGDEGTATAGENGLIVITYWDDKTNAYRRTYGIVGQDGIEANVAYRIDAGAFVRVVGEALAEQSPAVPA